MSLQLHDFPTDIKKTLKAEAAKKGVTLQSLCIQIFIDWKRNMKDKE